MSETIGPIVRVIKNDDEIVSVKSRENFITHTA